MVSDISLSVKIIRIVLSAKERGYGKKMAFCKIIVSVSEPVKFNIK